MSYWDIYNSRINLHGETQRDRNIEKLKRTISLKAPSNPSCKSVKLNGSNTSLIINSGTTPYKKEFETFPNQLIFVGDYIQFANSMWLVYEADSDDEIYIDGKMHQCNYLLRWQNSDREIIERWGYSEDLTKYSSGVKAGQVLTTADFQLGVTLPLDNETKNLRRDKRFIVDAEDVEFPDIFKLTGRNVVTQNYEYINRGGLVNLTFSIDVFNPKTDNIELGIADYNDHSPTVNENRISFVFDGNPTLVSGGDYKTIQVMITDTDGQNITPEGHWEVDPRECAGYIEYELVADTIKLKANDNIKIIGKEIIIRWLENDELRNEIKVKVVTSF